MNDFIILPHTADVRLQVEADTLEELFSAALSGMNTILKKDYKKFLKRQTIMEEIKIKSYDATSLLIDFLSEVLTRSHIKKVLFHSVTFIKFSRESLQALLLGAPVEMFDEDIKAVTYHEAEVIKNKKDNFETTIVFDI